MLKSLKLTVAGALAGAMALGMASSGAQAQEVTLKLHHFLSPASTTHKIMLVPWAEKVMKESGGRIKIDIYPSMQLGGTPPQLADQARDGVVDIVWTLPGYTPGRFTKMEVFELPFMHSNTVATNKAISEYSKKRGYEFRDYKIIALHVHAGNSFHSHDPINRVADLKGLKIRTPTRTGAWLIEAVGATPIGAPVPKIPEMLPKKIVDSVMIPFEVALPLKVHEMVDNHTLLDDPIYTRINTSVFMLAMNRAKYEAMAPDLRKVIDDNSGSHLATWLGEIWDAAEAKGMDTARASGTITRLPPGEVAKLREMTEVPVTARWVAEMREKGIDGAALVQEARELLAKYSK